jgi:hypothetical protein
VQLVVIITAGNSGDVLSGCLEHHRAIGFDGFIIVHFSSEDETPSLLVRHGREDDVVVIDALASGISPDEAFQQAMQIARDRFGADWTVLLDADERLFVRGRASVKSLLGGIRDQAVVVPRFNAVWADPDEARHIGSKVLTPGELSVAAYPVSVAAEDRVDLAGIPWVLTKIGPKSLIRVVDGYGHTRGGHHGVDQRNNRPLQSASTDQAIVVQLAFTRFERFAAKLRFISSIWVNVRQKLPAAEGWHWDRLARIVGEGPDAVRSEWRRQFMTPEQARALLGREVITKAQDAWGLSP